MQVNENFLIFYGQFLSSSIARHSMLIVIFLLPRTTRLCGEAN